MNYINTISTGDIAIHQVLLQNREIHSWWCQRCERRRIIIVIGKLCARAEQILFQVHRFRNETSFSQTITTHHHRHQDNKCLLFTVASSLIRDRHKKKQNNNNNINTERDGTIPSSLPSVTLLLHFCRHPHFIKKYPPSSPNCHNLSASSSPPK